MFVCEVLHQLHSLAFRILKRGNRLFHAVIRNIFYVELLLVVRVSLELEKREIFQISRLICTAFTLTFVSFLNWLLKFKQCATCWGETKSSAILMHEKMLRT